MCCDDKCFFFIRVRTGSLIFGYISAVISAAGVLACVGSILAFITTVLVSGVRDGMPSIVFNISQICFIWCTSGFTCTVLMLYGITHNKAVLLKTYVIYGMIQLVLLLVIMIISFCICVPAAGGLLLMACVIYFLCLYMVYLTYKEMVSTRGGHVLEPPNLMA